MYSNEVNQLARRTGTSPALADVLFGVAEQFNTTAHALLKRCPHEPKLEIAYTLAHSADRPDVVMWGGKRINLDRMLAEQYAEHDRRDEARRLAERERREALAAKAAARTPRFRHPMVPGETSTERARRLSREKYHRTKKVPDRVRLTPEQAARRRQQRQARYNAKRRERAARSNPGYMSREDKCMAAAKRNQMVRDMRKRGMTAKQIHQETGIRIGTVNDAFTAKQRERDRQVLAGAARPKFVTLLED